MKSPSRKRVVLRPCKYAPARALKFYISKAKPARSTVGCGRTKGLAIILYLQAHLGRGLCDTMQRRKRLALRPSHLVDVAGNPLNMSPGAQ